MARTKVTNADIFARLARGECANYRQNGCRGQSPCTIVVGEPCDYFDRYVRPLLDYAEFSVKYQREAKVTIAINPNAKIVRARRAGAEPRLALEASPAQNGPPPPVKRMAARKTAKPKSATPATTAAPPAPPATAAKTEQPVPPPVGPRPAAAPALSLRAPSAAVAPKKPTPRAPKPAAAPVPPPAPQLVLELVPAELPKKTMRKR